MSSHNLFIHRPDASVEPATPDEIIAAAREAISRRVRRGTVLSSPSAVRDFLALKLGAR